MSRHDLPPNTLVVSAPESGQKLLQFLQRRLCLPPALLHRWIRTGQTRLNGGRCKPFTRLVTNDAVRLPPFAAGMSTQMFANTIDANVALTPPELYLPNASTPQLLSAIGVEGDVWALYKPAGLPTHPGSGHADSLATRLIASYSYAPFKPTPAHRLDKDTSGILLVAASFEALGTLHHALRDRTLVKEYVAWIHGEWPHADIQTLHHCLGKTKAKEREVLCIAQPLRIEKTKSLLQIRLITGRTHQIRLQTASMGHPVVGDTRYGHTSGSGHMYLHAFRVALPNGKTFACLPNWPVRYALHAFPKAISTSKGCTHV